MTLFETECRQRVGQLQSAFIELYDSVGADAASPQDVARKFRLNKTLAWNVARLLQASDSLAAVSHVPGASSLEKVITATARHGADPQTVAKARQAVLDFRQMIDEHAGDRPTLDLIIDGTGRGNDSRLELSRKLAFRGNSGIYGIQARTRLKCNMLAPNPDDPTQLDMIDLSGYVGFRRLRADVRWPIFMVRAWSEQRGDLLAQTEWQPIEAPPPGFENSHLMGSFTRGSLPEIATVETPEGVNYVLGAGPVGNEGAFDCAAGEMLRKAVYRYRKQEPDVGEFGAAITAPTEQLVFDLIVHHELEFALKPQVLVFGRIFAHGHATGGPDDPTLLPIHQEVVEMPGTLPLVNTPLVPRYPQLIKRVYERMNWNPDHMRGVRLIMKYPPLGAHVILRFPLPSSPGA